jgi:hypothetical protein
MRFSHGKSRICSFPMYSKKGTGTPPGVVIAFGGIV